MFHNLLKMALSYYQLFELFLKSDSTENFIIAVTKELNCKNIREHENILKRFYRNLRQKWIAKHRFRNRFIASYGTWLENNTLTFDDIQMEKPTTSKSSRGRPEVSIDECSKRSQKRKLMGATENISTVNHSTALSLKYNKNKERVKGSITAAISEASPKRLQRIQKSIPTPPYSTLNVKYNNEEALALFLDLGLSKEKYTILRNSLKTKNVDILPSYSGITSAKKETVPLSCEITDVLAKVKLQDMLNHTAQRIITTKSMEELDLLPRDLTLLTKWGCDGSSG